MISAEKIPVFTGDLAELGREIIALRQAAKGVREHGGDVHTRFQHLAASYRAPEAGQLFATTQAVQDGAGRFADRLETVAGALESYAVEVVEIVKQLDMLRWQATVFVQSVQHDDGPLDNWRKDETKAAEHQAIWDGVNAAVTAFQQAEVACADKITALVDGTQWHINDGSGKQQNPYGFSAEQLTQADSLPWGTPEHREILPFGIDHHLEQAGISIVDNAVGSVKGLIDLFSPGEDGGAAREGLLRVIVGAEGYLLDPRGDRDDIAPAQKKLMDDSKPHAKEFAKAFVGWDDWDTNPGKAAGTVIFNGLTLGAGPLGAASKAGSAAGKAGTASRIAGAAAKVGEVLDPIGAAAKTAGAAARALPKVADLTAGVRAATDAATASDAAHSVIEYPSGAQLRIEDGRFIPANKGVPDTTPAPPEAAAADRTPSIELPSRLELVGAGARTPDATAHAGDGLPPQASHEAPQPSTGGGSGAPQHTDKAHDSGHGADSSAQTSHSGAGQGGSAAHHADLPDGTHQGSSGTGAAGGGGGNGDGPAEPSTTGVPEGQPDRMAAATDRTVDLDGLGMPVVWRTDDMPLYRSDNRSPEEIFESGFDSLDPSRVDLKEYVEESDASAFVSTSYRDDIGDEFGGKYTYEIEAPGGIDVNSSMGDHPLSYEKEVAFPGGIRPEYIKGAAPYNYATGELGDFIPNPNYRPEAERVE
ncbi:scabin-related ADP-ribosyltransferase [Streptomyces xantholiticus]|uniref:scabin-related ADP-ribosyltransferase n=1 Tax=Streptomyces xantholiticus TaxID=68285 RepID=UPI00167AA097|nr:hypothetical protein [Streptomyces xantholiticus]GGW54332.1 hypothetical protein GCM10010381_44810 [Streptomyces xantholiticus]